MSIKLKLAEAARTQDNEYLKLESDFFSWWARLPVDEELPSEAVGAYLRAAYGAGYVHALATCE